MSGDRCPVLNNLYMHLSMKKQNKTSTCIFSYFPLGYALVEGGGRCSLFGRHHVHTFDGVIYEFPGDCSYKLAGDCHHRTFSILGDLSHGRRKGVTVFLGETFELHLSVGGVLSQGAERLPLPYASSSVFAGFELGSVRLWSEEFGFSIRIDPAHNIELTLSKHHANHTCGLCGNYNSVPTDEYTAQEGFLTEDPYDFANSWAMNGASEACKRVTPPAQTCNNTGASDLMSRCETLRTSPVFLHCAHLVDTDAFAAVCESDVCHCVDGQECVCQALLEYARTCASHGLVLPNWHTQSQCTPKCPIGMQYSECSQACSTSCQSLNIHEVCREECVDGCSCAVGKVLDGDRCVEVSQCSCQHTGKRYPPGSTISQDCNTCVCRHGSWECTNEECPGQCVVSGQSHYKTFDDKFFTFSGFCQYLLAKDCQTNLFSAIIDTVQCADDQDAVCTRSVTLKFHELANQTVRLKHGGVVSVDGLDVQMPLINGLLRVQSTVLSSVRLNYGDDLQLDWDGRGRVLSPVYAGKMCGLCGNYNGNQGDDFLTAGGLVETRVEGFGNAWKMNAECDNIQKQPSDPCSLNPKRVRFAEEACAVLLSPKFEPCHHEVNPYPYLKNCRYDVCSCADGQECLCAAVSNYAAACSARGVLINWRGQGYCELTCPGNQVYEVCGSVCNQTCRSRSLPDSACRSMCEEGCFCPRGLYLTDTGECVPPDQCSCHYDGEIYQPNDMFADHHSIWSVRHTHTFYPFYSFICGIILSDVQINQLLFSLGNTWRVNPYFICSQILDEVLRRCVEPSECQVCMHNGERISHGKQIILNHGDPHLCQICHCEENTLTCAPCPPSGPASTLSPITAFTTPTPLPFSTPVPEDACDRAMDLAFLVDGSSSLSEDDFVLVKLFILGVVERFRMGSAHTRATVLLFHSGVKSYDMQVQKWIFRNMVRDLHYSGGDVAFMDEAFKYLSVYIYDKNKRDHAERVAIMLTASANPRPMRTTQRLLRKKDITVLTIALGPDVNLAQVNEITKATPSSRAYVLSSVGELENRALEITDYLCTLGLDPEPPKRPPTRNIPSPETTVPSSTTMVRDITFLIEGSDSVGEEGFNRTRDALVDVVASLSHEEEEHFRITVMQYSLTVTIEISRMELRRRELVLRRMRQIRWVGGAEVNTGHAIRSLYESVTTERPSHTPDQMVFLITQSPPTDVIQRPPSSSHTQVFPVGIGTQVRETDLATLSYPHSPIMLKNPEQLSSLGPLLVNISRTLRRPVIPTLPPRATLPPSVPCSKPMDVLFLLRNTAAEFKDMKTFVRSFIRSTNLGKSIICNKNINSLLVFLFVCVFDVGAALRFAVQTSISSTSGGRMGVPKVVVMLVIDRSTDSVQEPANEALTAGVSVFPIGVGQQYDQNELSMLAGPHTPDNIIQLRSTDDLLAMVTLDRSFTDKLCRVCVDDDGKERQPGEMWLLADGCHSLLCNPSGVVTLLSHRVNCERMEPPVCKNNLRAVRVNQTCGCSWKCPCMCMGSSTSHVVSFGGTALKLNGACSYLLLHSGGTELVLHTATCDSSPNQICMKSLELKEGGTSVMLKDDMKVTVDGAVTAVPFRRGGVSVTQIGALLHQLRSETQGFTLTFTPHSNEFTISLDLTMITNTSTTGICGSCSDDQAHLLLPDGSPSTDPDAYLQAWAVGECVWNKNVSVCEAGVAQGCELLASSVFGQCHAVLPPQDYVEMCKQLACHPTAMCDLITAYSSVCRQQGVCVNWRNADLCPMPCPKSMEYDACRTGCVEQCGHGGSSQCWSAPTEGCFCPHGTVLLEGECVGREACSQCVDQHGQAHQLMESWTPNDNPCILCVCLDKQRINCTALPCTKAKAPVCGKCEILLEKTDSKCCPEYECVCDTANCKVSDPPQCENGLSPVLTNPGECAPIYQCVCRKEECSAVKPSCPPYKKLSVKKTACCDVYECVCDCQDSKQTCPPGYITKEMTNDCGCVEVTCLPDKVCVVEGVVYQKGSKWEEKCKTCVCTEQTDRVTGLHIVQCVDPVCNQICPVVSSVLSVMEQMGCHCVVSEGVGEQWVSPDNKCVINECVRVNEEVFIQYINVSCQLMDTPTCPLGTELRCNTADDCCPSCHCVMLDVCTNCRCVEELGKYHLSCRKLSCSPCSEVTIVMIILILIVNTTREDGCTRHSCRVNEIGELVLETVVTTCPPFNQAQCLEHGGKISRIGDSCCEMCTEPECKRMVGLLEYIKVDDCQSDEKLELSYCEGKCSSKSVYSLEKNRVESQCVCCSATGTLPLSVSLHCPNGTHITHQVHTVTGCDCQAHACPTD
uniref:von Willebrand factor n=1 Tax=Astyanax mexicanus TaxID=7994 RepID=A0A8B9JTJ7_ASTMX